MDCACCCHVDELLSETLRTLEKLDARTQFIVQDLLPPAIWRTLPLTPTRGNLGTAFSSEMKKYPNVRVLGKTENGQAIYWKTGLSCENSAI